MLSKKRLNSITLLAGLFLTQFNNTYCNAQATFFSFLHFLFFAFILHSWLYMTFTIIIIIFIARYTESWKFPRFSTLLILSILYISLISQKIFQNWNQKKKQEKSWNFIQPNSFMPLFELVEVTKWTFLFLNFIPIFVCFIHFDQIHFTTKIKLAVHFHRKLGSSGPRQHRNHKNNLFRLINCTSINWIILISQQDIIY